MSKSKRISSEPQPQTIFKPKPKRPSVTDPAITKLIKETGAIDTRSTEPNGLVEVITRFETAQSHIP